MKNSLSNVQYLLFALLLFALTGCGASGNNTASADLTGSGKLTAKLQWADSKTAAKSVAAVVTPPVVAKVRLTITGATIPTVQSDFAAAATGGTVTGVYPGTGLIVAAQAYDAANVLIYEGFAVDQAVVANGTTDVGTITMTPPVAKGQDQACIECHGSSKDPSGQNLLADYKQSAHYTTMGAIGTNGETGCVGCHSTGPHNKTLDPAAEGKCGACHGAVLNNAHVGTGDYVLSGGRMSWTGTAPYINYSSIGTLRTADTASKATNCSSCHEPHNPLYGAAKRERADWAASRHAQTTTGFANGHSTGSCSRCHNPGGISVYLATGSDATSSYPVKNGARVLDCQGCHTNSANGALRTLKGAGVQHGYSSVAPLSYGKKQYPDVGASNICIVCHAADNTNMDPGLITASSTAPTANNHHSNTGVPAATTMFVKRGFLNLSTGTNGVTAAYQNSLKSDQDGGTVTSTHRKFGTAAEASDSSHFPAGTPAVFLTGGPCVVCHMTGSHSLKIDQKAITSVCNKCHSSEGGHDITTITAFDQYFIVPQEEAFLNTLNLAMDIFNSKQTIITLGWNVVNGNSNNFIIAVYRTTVVTATALDADGNSYGGISGTTATAANWTAAIAAAGYTNNTKLFGAISNVMYLSTDKAAYAHARTYARRLLYDSIDFLDDGSLNMSVGATAIARSLLPAGSSSATASTVSGVFAKGTSAFTDSTLVTLTSPTTEGMTYVKGWDRKTGLWTTVERP